MFTITFEMEYEEDAQLVRQVVADLQFGILGRYIDNSAGDPVESPRGSITPSFIHRTPPFVIYRGNQRYEPTRGIRKGE